MMMEVVVVEVDSEADSVVVVTVGDLEVVVVTEEDEVVSEVVEAMVIVTETVILVAL